MKRWLGPRLEWIPLLVGASACSARVNNQWTEFLYEIQSSYQYCCSLSIKQTFWYYSFKWNILVNISNWFIFMVLYRLRWWGHVPVQIPSKIMRYKHYLTDHKNWLVTPLSFISMNWWWWVLGRLWGSDTKLSFFLFMLNGFLFMLNIYRSSCKN